MELVKSKVYFIDVDSKKCVEVKKYYHGQTISIPKDFVLTNQVTQFIDLNVDNYLYVRKKSNLRKPLKNEK